MGAREPPEALVPAAGATDNLTLGHRRGDVVARVTPAAGRRLHHHALSCSEGSQVSRLIRRGVAAGGAIAAVAATVFVPRAVRRARIDDTGERVHDALQAAFPGADAMTVRVEAGVVTLRGEVDDLRDIGRLEAVARDVAGVTDVDNLLRLRLTGHVAGRPVLSA
jgi:hypothetical protein